MDNIGSTGRKSGSDANRLWRRSLTGLVLVAISVLPAFAQTTHPDNAGPSAGSYALNRDHSKILFSISHFVVSSTQGRFTTFDGKLVFQPQSPERGSVTIHISPASVSTGIAARDEHLRTADFFGVETFPVATFESKSLVRTGVRTGALSGVLTLHGVAKPITLNIHSSHLI